MLAVKTEIVRKGLITILILSVVMISSALLTGCIDPDEALPHYRQSAPTSPN